MNLETTITANHLEQKPLSLEDAREKIGARIGSIQQPNATVEEHIIALGGSPDELAQKTEPIDQQLNELKLKFLERLAQ